MFQTTNQIIIPAAIANSRGLASTWHQSWAQNELLGLGPTKYSQHETLELVVSNMQRSTCCSLILKQSQHSTYQ